MRVVRVVLALSLAALAPPALAESAPDLHVAYDTYAAGLDVAQVQAELDMGGHDYAIRLAYHTRGLIGFFYRGHQFSSVQGVWQHGEPEPRDFYGLGEWGGEKRVTEIDYRHGLPQIVALVPPNRKERQPVPADLRVHSIDTLSALALLLRRVQDSGRCEAAVHTFDGRRATELEARTVGEQVLPHTGRSIYSGPALRCDFTGRMLAGFKLGDDSAADQRPLHGSAWFAVAVPGAPPLPVRMRFQTRWFGEATMYLTAAGLGRSLIGEK